MKTFIFQFGNKLYKAQGKTSSSILEKMFTRQELIKLQFKGWEEV